MGFLDFFKRNKKTDEAGISDKQVNKYLKKLMNKYIQSEERIRLIHCLKDIGSAEAIYAMLQRFSFSINSHIKDEDEKELVYRVLIDFGDKSIEPLRKYLRTAEKLTLPLNALCEILSEEAAIVEIKSILDETDTEYEKNPDRKIQLIQKLGEFKTDVSVEVLIKFVSDEDENVRITAVEALEMVQDSEQKSKEPLIQLMLREESLRIIDRVCELLAKKKIKVKEHRKELEEVLTERFYIDKKGIIIKR